MPPITILKSELLELEKKIEVQSGIIQDQQRLIKQMISLLETMGVLPTESDTRPTADHAG